MTKPYYCNHEDFPCCGCGDAEASEPCEAGELPENFGAEGAGDDLNEFADDEPEPEPEPDDEPHGSHDLSDDGDALASAGWGTDEDYGGGNDAGDW
jgi:hypothetical protein